nr:GPO family capsid scaffolding protein [uncultured Brevundimonas sp.]
MSKKLTTKFTRIAVAGLTASDGRTIEAQWLRDMAANYNPATYTARVNVEHFRNASAAGPFPALGDVIALRVQEDEIEIAGKTEKRIALYAQIEGNETLQGYVAADQKKFTSIEVEPNFSGTGKAYLMGLAATDSPASLGTEALQFSARTDDAFAKIRKADLDSRKKHDTCVFSAAFATTIEFADQANQPDATDTLIDKIFAKFTAATNKSTEPKTPPAADPGKPADLTEFATAITAGMKELGQSFTQAIAAQGSEMNARFAKLESEHAAMKGQIEKTPDTNYRQRPSATGVGADGYEQVDC